MCQSGRCVVQKCSEGWVIGSNGDTCVQENTIVEALQVQNLKRGLTTMLSRPRANEIREVGYRRQTDSVDTIDDDGSNAITNLDSNATPNLVSDTNFDLTNSDLVSDTKLVSGLDSTAGSPLGSSTLINLASTSDLAATDDCDETLGNDLGLGSTTSNEVLNKRMTRRRRNLLVNDATI